MTSTTNTTADALQSVTHGVSVSSRSTTDASAGKPDQARRAQARAFARSQMDQLRREAAVGGGQNIDAFASLLGADGSDTGRWMQSHYAALFNQRTTASALVDRVAARRG